MNTTQHILQDPTRRLRCAALALVAVLAVALWAITLGGDSSQTAATLGATVAVTAAATVRRGSCRPAFLARGRHLPGR